MYEIKHDISIVIPVYNSEGNLVELVSRITKALDSFSYEIVFINDGSKDNSWNIIKNIVNKYDNITGINLRKNFGQDNAIMAGLRICNGEYIVVMDDDLQHSPYDIPALLEQCKIGFDVCYANFEKKKQASWKNTGSWFNGKMAEFLLQKPKDIYMSPFQIIHNKVIQEIVKYDGAYPYIQGLILQTTRNLTQIKIKHNKRFNGKGNFNLTRSITIFFKLATSFSVIPLRVATFIGIISALAGFLLSGFYVYVHFVGDTIIEGWTTLILINLIIGGLILMSLGIMGEYLGRMFLSINKKPQYVIKDIINKSKKEV